MNQTAHTIRTTVSFGRLRRAALGPIGPSGCGSGAFRESRYGSNRVEDAKHARPLATGPAGPTGTLVSVAEIAQIDFPGIHQSAGTKAIAQILMNEGTNKESLERLPDIDVRPNTGIVRSSLDEIKAVQTLLADVYKDAGDGRTLFRELVQNADDANARRLEFTVLERGWLDAGNSLLRGPALLVANDGPFPDKDREALHKAIGGSKEDDVDKIGTFGIGLKSVFHVCEAFLYMGAEESVWRAGVLNPWAGTGESRDTDPLHPDWDVVEGIDLERLRSVTTELLGETDSSLLLWIPLRRHEHRDRGAEGRRYGLGEHCPRSDELCTWFDRSAPAAMLLAQCGHLQTIETSRIAGPEDLGNRVKLMRVTRQASGWLGRYRDENLPFHDRAFEGAIASEESSWAAVGVESLGCESLRHLRTQPDWPQSPRWRNGRHATVPRKALAHAAVTVLRPVDRDANLLGTRLRWAVFLPLDDDPAPSSGAIVECDGPSPAWEIILHGYFWPSQDRRSIPGVTDESGNAASNSDMRIRWNRTLCEDLLLPLLPSAFANAVAECEERAARGLLGAVVRSEMLKNRMASVTRRHWLLPVVVADGVRWRRIPANASSVLSIPKWDQASESVRRKFVASSGECTGDVVFIDDEAPRFAGELDDWSVHHLTRLLDSIQGGVFASPQSLRWIEGLVRHVLGPDAPTEDIRAAAFTGWLAGQIGKGALAPTTRRSTSRESREELRDAWRVLCAALPKSWIVETPVDSQQAIVELATDGVIGEGLLPVPIGRRPGESAPTLKPDQDRLDYALSTLGRRLEAGGESERLRRSRLLLAETLLSIRPHCPMSDHLFALPLLRAIALPGEREEAWSAADLHRQIENRRVFASPASEAPPDYDSTDGTQPERPSDPKWATTELAIALDETVWLVNRDAVASVAAEVPSPAPENLASAVLRANAFAEPARRTHLLHRLAPNISDGVNLRLATRALLAGRAAGLVGCDTELFHARAGNEGALLILLRLLDRSWRAVDQKLVKALSGDILNAVSVGQADLEALHRLLDDCLDKPVDWTMLGDGEAVQLLRHLYSPDPEAQRRWRRIPLHRGVDGGRGAFNDRARRSTGRTGEMLLPRELRADVRLLDPDSELDHLYRSVPDMDHDGILQLILEDERPWRFAERIVQAVRSDDGQVTLPRDPDLRKLLRDRCWLPDRDGEGLAPDAVLVAPEGVLSAVSDLGASHAFGDKRLPVSVDPQIWRKAEPVVREILGRQARDRQVQRMADALDSVQVAQVDGGAWLVMPDPKLVDASLIVCALETTLPGSHPGWKLVHTVERILRDGGSRWRNDSEPLRKLAKALCAPVPPQRQIEMLACLANTKPAKDSPGGQMFNRLLGCFADTDGFFTHVLPKLDLPTQDGNWHASRDVARTEIGVARRHRLISELRPILRLRDDDHPPLTSHVGDDWSESALDTLEKYFEPWRDRLPHGAVGTFLSLLGTGLRDAIEKLAEQWLGEDVSIEGMRSGLVGPNEQNPCASVSVWVSPRIARGDRVSAVNILGSRVEMEAEADNETLFAIDPTRYPPSRYALAPLGAFWEVALRDVKPQNRTSSELTRLLGNTVERWASGYLKLDRERVNAWWSRWGKSSEADLGPVLASIKAHLPLTLRQLDVKDSEPLRNALREAERTQRKREQAPSKQTLEMESRALEHLSTLIEESEHRTFLWKRVNELMCRYGYGTDSVLLELAQNADDALVQAAQIKGEPLSPKTRRLLVRVHEHHGTPTVDVMHWGRPINDTGGGTFPAGRDHQWDQDLYFMMLMNLSSKSGEAPGEASSSSTTGRFGLGFKSVHLVSSSPSVVSGFIAFSIAGGLLPQERAVPDDADSWTIEGRRATRICLPLRQDVEPHALMRSLFDRFSHARALLPVFARQVREIVVEGGPFPGVHVFDGTPIEGAPGWSVGIETELPNHVGRWRFLRFRPADANLKDKGTAALAVGLRDGVPTAFGPDVPCLWNVTPTSENWGCGYVVNGPFKLDPGRTHVSLGNDTTLQAVSDLGHALGKGLIELHDVLTGNTEPAHCPMAGRNGRSFLLSLWKVLASGTDNSDELRQSLLRSLHGNGRGISAWMAARSIVPTDLPAPFPTVLPPMSAEMSWEVAGEDLGNPDLCAALTEIDDEDFRSLVGSRRIVSEKSERLLLPLCGLGETQGDRIHSVPLGPCHLLAELAERWDYYLTPARLHSLRPLAQDSVWNLISNDPRSATWRGRFRARSADGSSQSLRKLLLGEASGLQGEADRDLEEELLRSAIAPNSRILDPAYIEHREDWSMFRWLRVQHRVDAAEIADWYMDVKEDLRPAALRYLLYGELQGHVLSHLVPLNAHPPWLRDFDDVRQMLEDLCEEPWRRQRLLGALFPDHFHAPETPPQPTRIDSETFFIRLLEWWDDVTIRSKVIADYEKRAWPEWLRRDDISDRLQADSEDHWLALLVLGACRSLGLAQDYHHRRFLELAYGQGWWDVFKTPDDSDAWMKVLRGWQDEALAKLTYPRWMSLFPAIYQLSRYRDVYVRLLKSSGQRPGHMYQVTRLLAPRVDEALTGAGTRFDAPPAPLNMGLHWVLRELVRLDVVEGEHLFPDCWVPSEQVLRLLGPLGLDRPDNGMSNSQKAHAIFDFLTSKLETPTPTLHRTFDIPLRYVASNANLRDQFGLEQ